MWRDELRDGILALADAYALLGLEPGTCTAEQAEAAWRKKVVICHPDHHGNRADELARIDAARDRVMEAIPKDSWGQTLELLSLLHVKRAQSPSMEQQQE